MYRKINTAEAIKYFDEAVDMYKAENRIVFAAKLSKQIGEIYEKDFEPTLACKYF